MTNLERVSCQPPPETIKYIEGLKRLYKYVGIFEDFYANILNTIELEDIKPSDVANNLDKYIGWIPSENIKLESVLEKFDSNRENILEVIKNFNLYTKASLGILIRMWISFGVESDSSFDCSDPNVTLLKKSLDLFLTTLKSMDSIFSIDPSEVCPQNNCKVHAKLIGKDGSEIKEICSDMWSRSWIRSVQHCISNDMKPLTLNNYDEQQIFLKWLNEESKLPSYTVFWIGARKGNGTSFWWISNGKNIEHDDLKWRENTYLFYDCLSIINYRNNDFVFDISKRCNARSPTICEMSKRIDNF